VTETTILIIDDSETVRLNVKKAVEETEIFDRYLMSSDGMAGFKVLVHEKVDLILCDVVMPGCDGFKFLSLKKSKPEFQEIPVIMLTAQDDLETKVKTLTAGASDYLTKPFHPEELAARLNIHMKIKLLQDELREKNDRLEELSQQDPLTKLPNRRHFMTVFEREFERAKRTNSPLSYLMGDLDHFKKLNDDYGHVGGDHALIMVADTLRDTLRPYDLPGRYGGEEFSILLPDTGLEGALIVAERTRKAVEMAEFEYGEITISCTMSIGVATYYPGSAVQQIESLASLIKLADAALYCSKASGRNRFSVDPASEAAMAENSPKV